MLPFAHDTGAGHASRHALISGTGLAAYHRHACQEAAIPSDTTALMHTAANMQCAVLATANHEALTVRLSATAAVLSTATRAGNCAGWHESAQRNCKKVGANTRTATRVAHCSGTIVTLAFINRHCIRACLIRAATMVAAGKNVAVLDLRMPSRHSAGLATGNDQLAIAALLAGSSGDWNVTGPATSRPRP